ncbi:5-hydroxytryptamine receptor 3A-like [Fundulus heteroclitus]|uniref:5-hydroxytryptamine receptor 3A-like n=1 Tax=Fundulus heteroclitus TaxID=8078 RepID=UPI00165AB836|nr:5-hydroxytryptamine receptor 3A-like [Fundulus heteroclitus]
MTSNKTAPKWLLQSAMPTVVILTILLPALCSTAEVNCSLPNQPSLLAALAPAFDLSAIRPVENQRTYTNVSVYFTLYGILGVDEKSQLLVTYIWLYYWWKNEFISWDPEQCGSNWISLPKEKFWLPDIVINEFMEENKAPTVPYVYLYDDGTVKNSFPVRVVSSCNLNIYTFPFDIQNCSLTFNSYIYYAMEIRVFLGRDTEITTELSKQVMTTMGEWELLDISAQKVVNNDESGLYVDMLAFYIRVRRRATMYVVNLLLPSCFLITLDLLSFLLPPQSTDRSSFKMTLILGYTVFLLLMNDLLPVTGNTIPLINVFFSLCLALMVGSLLETILITNLLSNSSDLSPVPRWIRVLFLNFLGCLVCMPRKIEKPKEKRKNDVLAKLESDEGPSGTGGSAEEDEALQELKSLSHVLQAIRSEVEQQQKETQSSEEWIQCCPLKVKPSKQLFVLISLLMLAPNSSAILNCSQPSPASLLRSLKPVFELNSIRPVINMSVPTRVGITFTLFGILGVDEKTQVLTTFIWETIQWKSDFTLWDPEECDVEWIAVARNLLWVPDIVINEFMEKNSAPDVPYTYLHYDGIVYDAKPVRVVSSCSLNIYLFPFDIQNCTFTFNSYIHSSNAIDLEPLESSEQVFQASKEEMATMGEWQLAGISSKKVVVPTIEGSSYDELRFFISVRRHSTMYVVNLLIPSCFLITVDLFSFMLPVQNVDRSLFKMTLVLGYTVFLLSTNDLLPITGDTIPLINVFLSLCLTMMVTSLLETILITNLLMGSAHYTPPPRWIKVFVCHFLGRLVCLPPKPEHQEDLVIKNPDAREMENVPKENEMAERKKTLKEEETLQVLKNLGRDLQAIHQHVVQQLKRSLGSKEWIQVGLVIDRLLFIFYIIFLSVSFISIIIIWVNSYNSV